MAQPSQNQSFHLTLPGHATRTGTTPEPSTHIDMPRIRRRLHEMGLVGAGYSESNVSSREKELVDMVLRLTDDATQPDPSQLVVQAETISRLSEQRDFMIEQAEDQRSRWQSERDGWERMAEALIAQKFKPGNTTIKTIELERQCSSFAADNRALRDQLTDTKQRLSALETELVRLRPLLLMQPATSLHHHVHVGRSTRVSHRSRTKKIRASAAPLTDEEDEIDQLAEDDDPSGSYHASGEHYRKLDEAGKKSRGKGKGKRKEKPPPSLPLMSDARAEHILLAARKIGRQRAGMLAGFVGGYPLAQTQPQPRQENERDLRRRDDGPPSTPGNAPTLYTNPGYMFVSPQHQQSLTVPLPPGSRPPPVGYHIVQTPGRRPRAQQTVPGTGTGMENPPTPLDSLLSAARMMNEDGDGEGEGEKTNGRTRRASAIEEPESPLPKRRKTGGSAPGANVEGSRVKSALDVLADQAAAYSSGSKIGGGKGKVKATATAPPPPIATGRKPRTRAPPKPKAGVVATRARGKTSIDSGSATPRLISPAPRISTEPSPLDALPSSRLDKGKAKAKDDGHPPRKDFRPFVPPAGPMSLRPVTRWGDTDPSHQESSSPLRPAEMSPLPVIGAGVATAVHGDVESGDGEDIGANVAESDVVGDSRKDVEAVAGPGPGAEAETLAALEAGSGSAPAPTPAPAPEIEAEADVDVDVDADGSADADGDAEAEIDMEGEPALASQGSAPPASRTSLILPSPPPPPTSAMDTDPSPPPPPLNNDPPKNTSNPAEPPATTSQSLNLAPPVTVSRSISEDPGQYDNEDNDDGPRRASDQVVEPRLGTRAELRLLAEQSVDFGMMNVFDSNSNTGGHENGNGEGESQEMQSVSPGKRSRSTYIKWSQEEDDLLAQAVEKHGQKWDLVQQALPGRGYHQVRQRWLRKLGLQHDPSIFNSPYSQSGSGSHSSIGSDGAPTPQPKLGLAPLSSELAISNLGKTSPNGS